MNKVVKLHDIPDTQPELAGEELDDTELRKAAMEAFNDSRLVRSAIRLIVWRVCSTPSRRPCQRAVNGFP